MLGTYGFLAARVLKRTTQTVTRDIHPYPRTRATHLSRRAFGNEAFPTCFNHSSLSRLGFEHPMFPLQGEGHHR